MLRVFSVIS